MNERNSNPFLNKEVLAVLFLSFFIAISGAFVLNWIQQRMEGEKAPFTREQEEKQRLEIEENLAGDALSKFMAARLERNEAGAVRYLTENAMDEKDKNKFALTGDFGNYEVLRTENPAENRFNFIIKLYDADKLNYTIESIALVKILDQYFIDAVEIAG